MSQGRGESIAILDDGTTCNEGWLGAVKDLRLAVDTLMEPSDLLGLCQESFAHLAGNPVWLLQSQRSRRRSPPVGMWSTRSVVHPYPQAFSQGALTGSFVEERLFLRLV